MKKMILTTAAAIAVLGGCSSDGTSTLAERDAVYTPTGTIIPRKTNQAPDHVTIVDKQSLENDRTTGNGTNNGPGR
jgi:hypothetical protein